MPLKLRLKPTEKIVLNGAVVSAGDQGATLILHNQASLLRQKDIMTEAEANSPARRLYFQIMLMYMDPDNRDSYVERYMELWNDLAQATTLAEVKRSLMYIYNDVAVGNLYRALKTCRAVMAVESELLTPGSGLEEDGRTGEAAETAGAREPPGAAAGETS